MSRHRLPLGPRASPALDPDQSGPWVQCQQRKGRGAPAARSSLGLGELAPRGPERWRLFFDSAEPGRGADNGDRALGWPLLAGESD